MIVRMQRRIYGIENELGVVMRYNNKVWGDVARGYTRRMHKANDTSVGPFFRKVHLWHTNGGCSYIDTNEHPEYASPECCSVGDAALYAKAGEFIMRSIFSNPVDGARLILVKNNLGCDAEGKVECSFGCHENYLMHGFSWTDPVMMQRFVPFLITRQIMDGSGWWEPDGTYLFSQRSTCIEQELGGTTTNTRPLITTRDSLNDTGPMRRLHLILGDANILDVACFLKIGTTSLVLSLIEMGCAPIIEYRSPIQIMKRIARNPDITIPQAGFVHEGKELSAFDAQVLYHEAARHAFVQAVFDSDEIQAELQLVLDIWEQTLHALYRHDEQWTVGRLDHETKRYLAERMIKQRRLSSASEIKNLRKEIDIMYHNITERTLQDRMNIQWADRRLFTDKQIEYACYFPPRHTRAQMRGLFVASVLDLKGHLCGDIDWTCCMDKELPLYKNMCSMKDNPFETRTANFIEFLTDCLNLPHDNAFPYSEPSDC